MAREICKIEVAGDCAFCGFTVYKEDFRNKGSLKEWELTKLCQRCQDRIFNPCCQ